MIVHLNGRLIDAPEARISPFDRGFIFGDGVYEGLRAVSQGSGVPPRIVAIDRHIDRMRNGLTEAGIRWDPRDLNRLSLDLLRSNTMADAFVYWQVTRGTPHHTEPVRSRVPGARTVPTIFGYCAPQPPLDSFTTPAQRSALVCPDTRWTLGHIKSTSLMGNVLLTLAADKARADEAIFVRRTEDGRTLLTEAAATNVIVAVPDKTGRITLATPSLESVPILPGVTRAILLLRAPDIAQRAVEAAELAKATEIMLVGSTTMVASVTKLDGKPVGSGSPGGHAVRLLRLLIDAIREGT